jgi:uncharacterized protein YndB with AHSA1/START domain
MAAPTDTPEIAPVRSNGGPGPAPAPLEGIQDPGRTLPILHIPGAQPLVRDRWERLVTAVTVPDEPMRVWAALTEPEALRLWLARCHGSLLDVGRDCTLDFEDGEFFLVRVQEAVGPAEDRPGALRWTWRWLGIGQPMSVSWSLQRPAGGGTVVTATEDAANPPADWQTWNGGGWPGILDQLAAYLRTGMEWRWPWRRMGPYVQVELAAPPFQAWDQLMSPAAVKFWLQRMSGSVAPGDSVTILMGDASGMVEMAVSTVVDAGQSPPSFLPYIEFALRRKAWGNDVGGRLWIEPAGWGRSLLQVFHYGWEDLPGNLQLSERKILTSFWAGAMRRAADLFLKQQSPGGPHSWS